LPGTKKSRNGQTEWKAERRTWLANRLRKIVVLECRAAILKAYAAEATLFYAREMAMTPLPTSSCPGNNA
jgi:hypothetical protein